MKHQFFFTVFLLLFGSSLYGQIIIGPAGLAGFDQIGVVAPIDNYQQTHFQNPALLVRGNHKFDAFATYSNQNDRGFKTMTAGSMLTLNTKNAIGIALNRVFWDKGPGHFRVTTIPLSYARSFYKSQWMGFSGGVNLNILNDDVVSNDVPIGVGSVNETGFSGGFGLHGYRIFPIKEKEIFTINAGFSINDMRPETEYNFGVSSTMRAGGLGRWQRTFNNGNSINLDGAYQYQRFLDSRSNLYFHKVGSELRYAFDAISTAIAVKGGFIWEMSEGSALYRYNTFGGRIKVKGFYLDAVYLPNVVYRPNRNSSWNVGLGYQSSLN